MTKTSIFWGCWPCWAYNRLLSCLSVSDHDDHFSSMNSGRDISRGSNWDCCDVSIILSVCFASLHATLKQEKDNLPPLSSVLLLLYIVMIWNFSFKPAKKQKQTRQSQCNHPTNKLHFPHKKAEWLSLLNIYPTRALWPQLKSVKNNLVYFSPLLLMSRSE